jgi:hypothetical protein
MKPIACRALIVLPICIGVFVLTFFPLYYVGYVNNNIWNYYARKTNCLITDYDVVDDTCSYSCNCYQSCSKRMVNQDDSGSSGSNNDNSCTTVCSTCFYTCYDGYIDVSYSDNLNNLTASFEIYSYQDSSSVVLDDLNANYPRNTNITCYYNTRNPSDVRLTESNPKAYEITAFVMAGICVTTVIVWLIIEAVIAIRSNWKTIKNIPHKIYSFVTREN